MEDAARNGENLIVRFIIFHVATLCLTNGVFSREPPSAPSLAPFARSKKTPVYFYSFFTIFECAYNRAYQGCPMALYPKIFLQHLKKHVLLGTKRRESLNRASRDFLLNAGAPNGINATDCIVSRI